MKAAILHSADSVPVYGDFDDPVAGPGSEIVEFVAAGIHQLTRSVATGRHYGRGGVFPVIPGLNAVARTAGGELVFTASGEPPYGTFAERIASPGAMRFPLPDGARPEAVAAGVNPCMASWLPLNARLAETGKLGTVLVLGVTGISGFLAAQNARLLGAARVVGAGRSKPGLERAAAAGAHTLALTGDRDADAGALAKALDGDAPGLVLDFVWGPVAETAFRALAVPGSARTAPTSSTSRSARSPGPRRPFLLAAAQQEADDLRQRGRLRPRRPGQGPDPALHPADRRRLGPGAAPDLPAVRRRHGLDRLRRTRPARGPRPGLSGSAVPQTCGTVWVWKHRQPSSGSASFWTSAGRRHPTRR